MTYRVDSPTLHSTHLEVWSILKGAVDDLDLNDFGRPWPAPRGSAIAAAVARHEPELCIRAACEAREIVHAQDRAPNITALWERKLAQLAEARAAVREGLGVAA